MESKIKIIVFLEDCRAIIYKQVKDQIEFGFAIETTFVVPHCLAIQKQGLMIAGIDVEPAGFFSQASHKRSRKVYLINNFTLLTNKSRLLKYDTSIHILDIADENQKHIPIKSIHWIEDERILISAWHNKIYVHDTLSMSNKNTT